MPTGKFCRKLLEYVQGPVGFQQIIAHLFEGNSAAGSRQLHHELDIAFAGGFGGIGRAHKPAGLVRQLIYEQLGVQILGLAIELGAIICLAFALDDTFSQAMGFEFTDGGGWQLLQFCPPAKKPEFPLDSLPQGQQRVVIHKG